MRIGLSLSSTIQPGKDLKAAYLDSIDRAESLRKRHGFGVLELVCYQPAYADDLIKFKEDIIRHAHGFEALTLHAPFHDINLASFHRQILEISMEEYKRNIDLAFLIGAKKVVVHPITGHKIHLALKEMVYRTVNMSAAEIVKYAKTKGVEICFENMQLLEPLFKFPQEFESIVDVGGMITLDTGHAITNNIDPIMFLDRFKDNVRHVHLVDNFRNQKDMHIPLGEGDLDLMKVVGALKDTDLSVILEYNDVISLEKSVARIKQLL